MPQFSRMNALDQILDIQGSFSQSSSRVLTDEPAGFGAPTGAAGAAGSISGVASGVVTLTGLTGMTANSVGNFLTISGAANGSNDGTFLIVSYISSSSVGVSNSAGVTPDAGVLTWTERRAYCLNDDLDFERTDRSLIKGVAYSAPIPTYQRPTAVGTNVPANLTNIAGKTTDARGFIFNRLFRGAAVAVSNTVITITSAGNLEHSDAVDKTGVPCFDVPLPYGNDYLACYVRIVNPADGTEFEVLGGANEGERIYGLTQNGSSTSPNSVEVALFSVPGGGDLSGDSSPYTWEAGLPTSVDLVYGYFQRLDLASDYTLRTIETLGVEESGALRQDVTDLQEVIGVADGATFLTLANTGSFFPFVDLPDATPSVTEALNTLNAQIGDRNYTGAVLSDGQTITASLQALANAVSGSSVVRYIERLAADVLPNTAHTLPGGATYVLDGTDNGLGLSVYTRGLLRDPGTVLNGDDYAETSITSITFYAKQKLGDHINYYVYS